jgi:hypothetical protein
MDLYDEYYEESVGASLKPLSIAKRQSSYYEEVDEGIECFNIDLPQSKNVKVVQT